MSQKISRILAVPIALSAIAAAAQTTAPTTQTTDVVKITLHPVATSQPALQYPLLPPMTERRPGNAAVQYMIAANRLPPQPPIGNPDNKSQDFWNHYDDQLYVPADAFSPAIAAGVLDQVSVKYIDLASRRDYTDWDVDYRATGYDTPLPQLNSMRAMANVVALRSRLDIARGDYAAADYSLQTGFAMTMQLNEQAVLVQGFVGLGIARLTLDTGVQSWIARGGPNLYWPLSNLPQLFNLVNIPDAENSQLSFTEPWFRQAVAHTLATPQWKPAIEQAIAFNYRSTHFDKLSHSMQISPRELDVAFETLKSNTDPLARKQMKKAGKSDAQIEAIPTDERVGEFLVDEYQSTLDECWKAWPLPFPQAEPILRQAYQNLKRRRLDDNPLLKLIPNVYRGRGTVAQLDQRVAVLRVIEAIRDYAARHQGKLPMTLADITALPIPLDPVTGKPFGYQLRRSTAVLTPAALPDSRHPNVSYELETQ